jgi:hypothetical protein
MKTKNFSKLLNSLMIVSVVMMSGCVVDPDEYDDIDHSLSTDFYLNVNTRSQYRLYVDNINGTVKIEGTSDSRLIVRGEKGVKASTRRDAEDYLKDLEIRVDNFQDEVQVQTLPPRSRRADFWVDYRIQVPRSWQVVVDQVNGTVQVFSTDNSVDVLVSNGDIVTSDIYGSVQARTTNGDIETDVRLAPEQTCDLQTTNGRIELRVPRTTSATFWAQVTNGVISLLNLPLQDVTESPRQIQGVLGDGKAAIHLQTTNGSIQAVGY